MVSPTTQSLFKKQVETDIKDVFFCLDEFTDKHRIDGEEMDVLIDDNELVEREKKKDRNVHGAYVKQILIYVKESQFGRRPKVGSRLKLDHENYIVTDCTEEMGVYAISLEANKA